MNNKLTLSMKNVNLRENKVYTNQLINQPQCKK